MGNFSTATGMVTLLMMLAGRVVFKKFGWGVAAMITPITLLTTGQHCLPLCEPCVCVQDGMDFIRNIIMNMGCAIRVLPIYVFIH